MLCLVRRTTVSGAAPNRPGPHDQGARRRLHAAVNPQTAARGRCILAQTSNRSRPPGHHTTLQVSHLCFGTPLHLRDRASPADAIGCTVLLSSAATFWCLPRATTVSGAAANCTGRHDKGPAVACMRLLTRKPSTRARSLFKDQQSGARSRYATLQGSHLRFDAPAHCRDRASPVEAISSARLCCPAPPDFGCLPRVTFWLSGRGEHREPRSAEA